MKIVLRSVWTIFALLSLCVLAGCGGNNSDSSPLKYVVFGTISWPGASIYDTDLRLINNREPVAISGINFIVGDLYQGDSYNIQVDNQPTGYECIVENGVGVIQTSSVDVQVTCTNVQTFTLGGTVTGLEGTGLQLSNGETDAQEENLEILDNGEFTFESPFNVDKTYEISVLVQPAGPAQVCTLTNASGTVVDANITNIEVVCETLPLSLLSSNPADGEIGVSRDIEPTLTFSAPIEINASTSSVELEKDGDLLETPSNIGIEGNTITFTPEQDLPMLTTYNLNVTTALKGIDGEELDGPVTTQFTTEDGSWQAPQIVEEYNTSEVFTYYPPQITFDGTGNAFAVWTQLYISTSGLQGYEIWGNRYDADRGDWELKWERLDDNPNSQNGYAPSLAVDAEGNAIAVWYQEMNDNDSGGSSGSIWASRYDVEDKEWQPDPYLVQNSSVSIPQIAFDGNGNAIVVWRDAISGRINSKWYKSDTGWDGDGVDDYDGVEDGAVTGEVDFDHPLVIAMDSLGNVIVAWAGYEGNLWVSHYDIALGAWSDRLAIQPVDPEATSTSLEPSSVQISMHSDGSAWITWAQSESYEDREERSLNVRAYSPDTGWGDITTMAEIVTADSTTLADSTLNTFFREPQITVNGEGNVLLAWREAHFVNEDYDSDTGTYTSTVRSYRIVVNRYDTNIGDWVGSSILEDTATDETISSISSPSIFMDDNGNASVVWRRHYYETTSEFWTSRYVKGERWGEAHEIEAFDGYDSGPYNIAVDSDGNGMMLMTQKDKYGRINLHSGRFE